jgi:hypothetical protein
MGGGHAGSSEGRASVGVVKVGEDGKDTRLVGAGGNGGTCHPRKGQACTGGGRCCWRATMRRW